MDISVLKQQIKNNQIDDFYIFTGDEWAVQKIYIQKIAECKNLEIKYIDSIKDIYSSLINPRFIDKNYCYVVRDDKDILEEDKLQQQLLNGLLKKNVLILLLTHLDRRIKVFKVFDSKYIDFPKMSVETLKKYVKNEINLSNKNCERLINICEQDYGRILLEIDKIKNIAGNPDDIFKQLVEDGTIYVPPLDAVFDLVDAILKRNYGLVFELLQDCYDIGEANLVVLSNLYNATKQLLQVQNCDGKDIMETCGITYPQMQAALSRKGKYSTGELINDLKLIRDVEKGIKIGNIEDNISVEYVLCNML